MVIITICRTGIRIIGVLNFPNTYTSAAQVNTQNFTGLLIPDIFVWFSRVLFTEGYIWRGKFWSRIKSQVVNKWEIGTVSNQHFFNWENKVTYLVRKIIFLIGNNVNSKWVISSIFLYKVFIGWASNIFVLRDNK